MSAAQQGQRPEAGAPITFTEKRVGGSRQILLRNRTGEYISQTSGSEGSPEETHCTFPR